MEKLKEKIIRNSLFLLKVFILLFFISLSTFLIYSVKYTISFFSDNEILQGNNCVLGSLDISLRADQDNFVPQEISSDINPTDSVYRDIYIKNQGNLPFFYRIYSQPSSVNCNIDFYSVLWLDVWYSYYAAQPEYPDYDSSRALVLKYSGLLKDFQINSDGLDFDLIIPNSNPYFSNIYYQDNEHWYVFKITYPYEAPSFEGNSCQFKFVFEGWQDNLNTANLGFSDSEEIYSTLVDAITITEEDLNQQEDE